MNRLLLIVSALPSAAAVLCPVAAAAGIEFQTVKLSHTAKHSEAEAKFEFGFSVTGDKPVRVLDLKTFCGCLSAKTDGDRKIYQPGEKGSVEATFSLGSFEGEQVKELVVTTDDPDHRTVSLTAAVLIPPLYEITPSQATWTVGDPVEPRTIRVRILGDDPVHLVKAVSTREKVKSTFREVTAGREYEVQLTPESTGAPLLGMIRLETDSPFPRYQRRLVFFNIAAPKRQPQSVPALPAPPLPSAAARP